MAYSWTRRWGYYIHLSKEMGLSNLSRSSLWRVAVFRLNIQGWRRKLWWLFSVHTISIHPWTTGRLRSPSEPHPRRKTLKFYHGSEAMVLDTVSSCQHYTSTQAFTYSGVPPVPPINVYHLLWLHLNFCLITACDESLLYGLLTWAGCFQSFSYGEVMTMAGSSKQLLKI